MTSRAECWSRIVAAYIETGQTTNSAVSSADTFINNYFDQRFHPDGNTKQGGPLSYAP